MKENFMPLTKALEKEMTEKAGVMVYIVMARGM
jgi:hypothetical protein